MRLGPEDPVTVQHAGEGLPLADDVGHPLHRGRRCRRRFRRGLRRSLRRGGGRPGRVPRRQRRLLRHRGRGAQPRGPVIDDPVVLQLPGSRLGAGALDSKRRHAARAGRTPRRGEVEDGRIPLAEDLGRVNPFPYRPEPALPRGPGHSQVLQEPGQPVTGADPLGDAPLVDVRFGVRRRRLALIDAGGRGLGRGETPDRRERQEQGNEAEPEKDPGVARRQVVRCNEHGERIGSLRRHYTCTGRSNTSRRRAAPGRDLRRPSALSAVGLPVPQGVLGDDQLVDVR